MRQRREIPIHIYRYCATLANFALACIMIHSITQTVQILQTSHCTLSNGAIKYSNNANFTSAKRSVRHITMKISIANFHLRTISARTRFQCVSPHRPLPPALYPYPPPKTQSTVSISSNFGVFFITERFNADL